MAFPTGKIFSYPFSYHFSLQATPLFKSLCEYSPKHNSGGHKTRPYSRTDILCIDEGDVKNVLSVKSG